MHLQNMTLGYFQISSQHSKDEDVLLLRYSLESNKGPKALQRRNAEKLKATKSLSELISSDIQSFSIY